MKETKKKNLLIIGLIIIIIGLVALLIIVLNKDTKTQITDALKFSEEYTEVPKDNVYTYKTSEEIIKILENGTGTVLLGFPECPWCQRYAVCLNEVAKDLDIEKIYYYNILEDRKNNTETYQKIVSLIQDYLQYDDEGNKKIYVPAVISLNKGEIVGFDDETSWDTKGFKTPEEYWTNEEVTELKDKLTIMLSKSNENMCTSCNK